MKKFCKGITFKIFKKEFDDGLDSFLNKGLLSDRVNRYLPTQSSIISLKCDPDLIGCKLSQMLFYEQANNRCGYKDGFTKNHLLKL